MPQVPEYPVLREAVALACRAPSVHNSQPWKWVSDGSVLHLFADRDRLVPVIDRAGREMILSCGAVLDHLRVAISAAGWDTQVTCFPDRTDADHVAVVEFSPSAGLDTTQCRRAEAIPRRRTDRLPLAAPHDWPALEATLRAVVEGDAVMLAVVADDDRAQLAAASRLTESIRRQDPTYQSELRWWTSPFELEQGIPASARVSVSEADRVDVARSFPTTGYGARRARLGPDHAKIVVLSTASDSRSEVLRCGEVLSTVLLDCAVAGSATCALTHLTEIAPSRRLISQLTGQPGLAQVLIRVGQALPEGEHPPATPRRPAAEVLSVRR
ncbi:MAG: NAD(P)H nitroreductase [Mycolicibacterium sp.]|uniref:Acg family FMN-binding oxidoreductase n=1 Tax=Mycolicibacterium sp. TaxID=2320850 RepID=UPI003D14A89C